MKDKYVWNTVNMSDTEDSSFCWRVVKDSRLQFFREGAYFTLTEKQFDRLMGMQYSIKTELQNVRESNE